LETHTSAGSTAVPAGAPTARRSSSPGDAASAPPRLTITALTERIKGEYVETPGLVITVDQAVRFWVLDAQTCARILAELRELGFLVESADGYYRRRSTT
jgi:hypothetical protein